MKKEEIKKLLFNFWQSSSDICPLELSKAEEQEKLFEYFVEKIYKPKQELVLYNKDYEWIKEKSSYNHNYYKYIGSSYKNYTEILVVCNENHNYYSYYLVELVTNIFLGCSEIAPFKDDKDFVEIYFREVYT